MSEDDFVYAAYIWFLTAILVIVFVLGVGLAWVLSPVLGIVVAALIAPTFYPAYVALKDLHDGR